LGQTSAPPTAIPASARLPISTARDFDPEGNPSAENPQLVKLAVDGNLKTRWRTVTYIGDPRLGRIKRGVGVVVDLGRPQQVRSVRVSVGSGGTSFDVRVPTNLQAATAPMSSDRSWQILGHATKATGTADVTFPAATTTRFVLVYLTSLPKEGSGYRGSIYEIEAFS
jgi:putative peptidoglycan lipid II flippase